MTKEEIKAKPFVRIDKHSKGRVISWNDNTFTVRETSGMNTVFSWEDVAFITELKKDSPS